MSREIARIEIDRSACIGAGLCVEAAPNVFQLDDENIAVVTNPEGDSEEAIWEAAEGCPTAAIHLYDASGKKLFPDL